ncbi:MAG: phage portal protein, partial [Lacticaseibacillus paracasei]|nr:phage portal protein [Lacticaseibacillus paracasei]
ITDEADAASKLKGLVSDQTMLSTLSFVDDPKAEIKRIADETAQKAKDAATNSPSSPDFQKFMNGDDASGTDAKTVQQVSLNGSQITSMISIVQQVASHALPRESAIQMLTSAFPFDEEKAAEILGDAGKGFELTPDGKPSTDGGSNDDNNDSATDSE